jgi:hypothetical protein
VASSEAIVGPPAAAGRRSARSATHAARIAPLTTRQYRADPDDGQSALTPRQYRATLTTRQYRATLTTRQYRATLTTRP